MMSDVATVDADGGRSTSSGVPGPATTIRLATVGGTGDRLRVALTATAASVATVVLLATASVYFTGPDDGPYQLEVLNQAGLRQGVIIGLLSFCALVLLFVGQCSRVGAPARDRRLAAMRMAGASPGDVERIVAVETGLSALLGSLAGAVVYFVGRPLLNKEGTVTHVVNLEEEIDGRLLTVSRLVTEPALFLPTDVPIPIWAVLLLTVLLPVGATATALLSLRRVSVTPFGVVRSEIWRPPTILPMAAFAVGLFGLALWSTVADQLGLVGAEEFFALGLPLALLCVGGLLLMGGPLASLIGRTLADRAKQPALLIASRRLIAHPFMASKATTSVLASVFVASLIQGVRQAFLAGVDPDDPLYRPTFDLLDWTMGAVIIVASLNLFVVSAEAVVARRRNLAAVRAGGAPRGVLMRAILLETLLPLLPMVLVSIAAGTLAARGVFGTRVDPANVFEGVPEAPITVPIPWERLGVLAGATLLGTLAVTACSLLFLPTSTKPTEFRAAA